MKHLKRFNENISSSIKEIEFNEDMMYKTMMIMNLIPNPYSQNITILNNIIKNNIEDRFNDRFRSSIPFIDFVAGFIQSEEEMETIFSNVVVHPGSNDEDEYVSALLVDGILVLILHSPERGNSIRIHQYASFEAVEDIIKELCILFNQKL
jgi:hypothetical protein